MLSRTLGVLVVSAASLAAACAGDLVSGLQVGKGPSPFHPLNVTGERAGKKNCLV